jgi:hypothetical protein
VEISFALLKLVIVILGWFFVTKIEHVSPQKFKTWGPFMKVVESPLIYGHSSIGSWPPKIVIEFTIWNLGKSASDSNGASF